MGFDFLNKFKATWKPNEILDDAISGNIGQLDEKPLDDTDEVAQRLCDHLNQIMDFRDRLGALDYLSEQSLKNFGNLAYSTEEPGMINSIISLGGKDNTVDFELIKHVVDVMFEWYNLTAANAITSDFKGEL